MSEQKQFCEERAISSTCLSRVVNHMVQWMSSEVLPLWTSEAVNRDVAAVYSSLKNSESLDHPPRPDVENGWLGVAQAQVIYILSQAQFLGWLESDETELVHSMIGFSGRHGVLPCRSDGFVCQLNGDFSIADGRRLLLDHAFFMMASTASFVAYDVGNDLRRAYNIMHWLDIKMSHPEEGWCHEYGKFTKSSSESYLHCLQAFLYLFEVTKKPAWLERASVVYDLFVERFFDPENFLVHRYMVDMEDGSGSREEVVSVTQMFSWVWLLRRYQYHMGDMAGSLIGDIAEQLYGKAKTLYLSLINSHDVSLISSFILASSHQARSGDTVAEVEFYKAIEFMDCNLREKSLHGWCPDRLSSSEFTSTSLFYLFEAIRESFLYVNPEKREVPLREVGGL